MPQFAQTVVRRYFAIDADHDISGDVVQFSLDKVTWPATGVYVAIPTTRMLAVGPAPKPGLVRYWFTVLFGPGNQLIPYVGNDIVYAKIQDSPELLYFAWEITTPTL